MRNRFAHGFAASVMIACVVLWVWMVVIVVRVFR